MTEIPSKDEELRDIGLNMSVVLDAKIILRGNMVMMMLGIILESAIKVYYIMRKLLQIAIVLAKCDNFFTK